MIRLSRARPATTFIELLIFLAILGMVVGITLPLLFSATENRILQTTISIVEQNGAQILGNVSQRIRAGETILSPAAGQTGSVLVLRTGSGAMNPVIIGTSSGKIVIVEHLTRDTVSTEQVAVTRFVVRNTSTSALRQSVSLSFTVTRTIRLKQPHSYTRSFETTVSLLPADIPSADACGCLPPACIADGTYRWEICESTECYSAETQLDCES